MQASARHTLIALSVYFAFLLISGAIGSISSPIASNGDVGLIQFILFCGITGIVEEAVFTGAIYRLLGASTSSMYVVAALFALAHLSFSYGVVLGVLKVVQAFAFSLAMLGALKLTGRIAVPMIAHALFDLAYFLNAWQETHSLPPYPPELAPDANIAVLVITTLSLGLIAAIILSRMHQSKQSFLHG